MPRSFNFSMINDFTKYTKVILFLSSYIPLFMILSVRQVLTNVDYLHWGGLNCNAVETMLEKFGVAMICLIVAIIGAIGCNKLIKRIDDRAANGRYYNIVEISSLNDEPLSYVATYIIPFMMENNLDLTNAVTLILMLVVIGILYSHSKLLLVNPWLSMTHSIYSVKYMDNKTPRQALLISRSRDILEGDEVKIYNVGYQLFYGKK